MVSVSKGGILEEQNYLNMDNWESFAGTLWTYKAVHYFYLENYVVYKKFKDNACIIQDKKKQLIRAVLNCSVDKRKVIEETYRWDQKNQKIVKIEVPKYEPELKCDLNDSIILAKNDDDNGMLTFCTASDDGLLSIAKTDTMLYYFVYNKSKKNYVRIAKELGEGTQFYCLSSNGQYLVHMDSKQKKLSLLSMIPSIEQVESTIFNNDNSENKGYIAKITQFIKDKWRYLFGSAIGAAGMYYLYHYLKGPAQKNEAMNTSHY